VPEAMISHASRPVPTPRERGPTSFPSSAPFRHPRSSARSFAAEEPRRPKDEPTKAFIPMTPREERRLPEDRDAFHRHDTRRNGIAERRISPAFAPALPLTPPTLCPQDGESALKGLASVTVRSPAFVTFRPQTIREYRHLLHSPRSRLGLTTQARWGARPTRPSTRTGCPARTDAGRSA